jgi:hypothetical protein
MTWARMSSSAKRCLPSHICQMRFVFAAVRLGPRFSSAGKPTRDEAGKHTAEAAAAIGGISRRLCHMLSSNQRLRWSSRHPVPVPAAPMAHLSADSACGRRLFSAAPRSRMLRSRRSRVTAGGGPLSHTSAACLLAFPGTACHGRAAPH